MPEPPEKIVEIIERPPYDSETPSQEIRDQLVGLLLIFIEVNSKGFHIAKDVIVEALKKVGQNEAADHYASLGRKRFIFPHRICRSDYYKSKGDWRCEDCNQRFKKRPQGTQCPHCLSYYSIINDPQ